MSGRPKTSVTGVAGWFLPTLDRRCHVVCFRVHIEEGLGEGMDKIGLPLERWRKNREVKEVIFATSVTRGCVRWL